MDRIGRIKAEEVEREIDCFSLFPFLYPVYPVHPV
jgi:hypothetical protein